LEEKKEREAAGWVGWPLDKKAGAPSWVGCAGHNRRRGDRRHLLPALSLKFFSLSFSRVLGMNS